MLLETKNIKKNEFYIYSRNSMDEDYNYRIVFRNDPKLYHRKISFDYTKKLIIEYFPKNLIAYRILTNFPDIVIPASQYGCIILLNDEPELIFTDPVFAVKTIEEFLEVNSNDQFRFRIQKVGYSTISKSEDSSNYKEEFFYDLNIKEAINQNDEIYLESVLEKNEQSKPARNNVDAVKHDAIFVPEDSKKKSDERIIQPGDPEIVDKDKRDHRQAEGNLAYGGKKLHLGKAQKFREENKVDEQLFQDESSIKDIKSKTQIEIRKDQFRFREQKPVQNTLFKDQVKNDIRINLTEDEKSEYKEFRKTRGTSEVKLRKVEFDEDGSEKINEITPQEKKSDDLFTSFLRDLQSESKLKIKKQNKLKRKTRESNIIQLFKSLKKEQINLEPNGEINIVIKPNKNSDNQ